MYVLKVVCENFVDASPEVVKWNSWDGEHLRTVHGAYDQPASLVVRAGQSLFIDKFRVPLLGIRLKALVYTAQWDDENQVSYTLTPFFLAKNTINVTRIDGGKTSVRVTYEFLGNYFQSLLFPILKRFIEKWNRIVWQEDLPLKLRREKALSYGFVDFRGIPENQEMRKDRRDNYRCPIPVPMTRNVQEARHPFFLTDRV